MGPGMRIRERKWMRKGKGKWEREMRPGGILCRADSDVRASQVTEPGCPKPDLVALLGAGIEHVLRERGHCPEMSDG